MATKFSCNVPGCWRRGQNGFTTAKKLAEHKRAEHSRDFPCDVLRCRYKGIHAFYTAAELDEHKRTQHSEDGGRDFPRDAPEDPFFLQAALQEEVDRIAEEEEQLERRFQEGGASSSTAAPATPPRAARRRRASHPRPRPAPASPARPPAPATDAGRPTYQVSDWELRMVQRSLERWPYLDVEQAGAGGRGPVRSRLSWVSSDEEGDAGAGAGDQ